MDGVIPLADGTLMPIFRNGVQMADEPVDGYRFIGTEYDGFRNKIHIQPVRFTKTTLGVVTEAKDIGQDYTCRIGFRGVR